MRTPPQPLAYSLDEIPQVARVGLSKIKEEIAAGKLPVVKIGKRTLVLDDDLRAYLVRHRVTRGNGSNGSDAEPPLEPAPAPAVPPGLRGRGPPRPRRK